MTSERIKEIQQQTAYPDSISVQQALLQVWNECSTSSQTEISDEQAIEMLKDINKQPMRFHCVPKEISDEEVEMAALLNEPRVTRRAFRSGAAWYREQLKQRQ